MIQIGAYFKHFLGNIIFLSISLSAPNSIRIRPGNRIVCEDTLFYYHTEKRIPIRFAANRSHIRTGNRMSVDGPLRCVYTIGQSRKIACRDHPPG
jgi:hypothetical protein